MSGYHSDAELYQISSWVIGCLEKEIDSHVNAERERIIKLLQDYEWTEISISTAIALIKGETNE